MAASCPIGLTFLWPPFAFKYFRYLLIMDLGELLLVLWLLVMAVNAARWWERVFECETSAAGSASRRVTASENTLRV